MKITMYEPNMVREARQTGKGLNIWLEILIFIAIFFVGEMMIALPMSVYVMISLVANSDFFKTGKMSFEINSNDLSVGNTTGAMFISLFGTIFMIIIVLLFCRFVQKRKPATIGFRKNNWCLEYLVGLLAGLTVFSMIVGVCVAFGALEFNGVREGIGAKAVVILMAFFVGFLIQGMSEEVLCRGYFLVSVARRYNIWLAIMVNAIGFSAFHLLNAGISVLAFINLVLYGIFSSIYFVKRGNIWGVAAFHSIWNFVQGNLYGIKVSGMDMEYSIFTMTPVKGNNLINGGEFGLEGGIVTTVVLLAGILILFMVRQKDYCMTEENAENKLEES